MPLIDGIQRRWSYYVDRVGGNVHRTRCYSQEGEDLILQQIFHNREHGFYVDVGAHHPRRFSNTFLLYRRGWRGINIDAMPGSMTAFKLERPRDVNLELGIGEQEGILGFHVFREPALNTFDRLLAERRKASGWQMEKTIEVRVVSLASVLEEHRPGGPIDLLSIDVEGLDESVLRSLGMPRFLPAVIVTEHLEADVAKVLASAVGALLGAQGYRLFSKLYNSAIWVRGEPWW